MTAAPLKCRQQRVRGFLCCALSLLCLILSHVSHVHADNTLAMIDPTPEVDQELRQFLKSTIERSDSFVDRFDAEVWLMSKQTALERFIKDPAQRLDILREIHRAASLVDISPEIVLAVIEVESHFDRFAISRVGAQGMMQVMPFWKNEIGHPEDNLTDIATNLRYGCAILKHYLERANGHLPEALARYNGSYGKLWYPRRVMDAWERNWR